MIQFRYLPNVTTLVLDTEKCIGCGLCTEVCPHGVFAIEDRKAVLTDRDACMECGACARNCAAEAISVRAGVGCAAGVLKGAIGCADAACCSAPREQPV